jgi:predicted nucleotidyltransferase
MVNSTDILKTVKIVLQQRFGSIIQDVILFGSQAMGTAHEDSDYDVLIVLNKPYDWQFRDQVIDAIYDLELQYDILIDTFLISTHELRHTLRGAQPLFVNALKHGVYA